VPAVVSLFGRWNWWLPEWLARALFVEPSPLRPVRTVPPDVLPEPDTTPVGIT
jgi:RND superfamily putative drug exporter